MKKLMFVVNPRSGIGRIKNKLLDILDLFIKCGYEVEIFITQKPLDARNIVVKKGDKKQLIICSGGDGTLNEAVCGLMKLKTPPPLGYIPAGSTNDYASSLNLPRQMMQAAQIAALGVGTKVDVGYFCGEKYFIYIAGFGAFTEVSYLTPQDKKNALGHQAYIMEAVRHLTGLKSYHMKITWEDHVVEDDFIFGMVTNTISVAGFKGLIKGDVALNDGYFECLFIPRPKTPLEFSNIVTYLLLKDDKEAEFVHRFQARKLEIQCEEEVDWVLDGEFGGSRSKVVIENLREKVEIRKNLMKKQ